MSLMGVRAEAEDRPPHRHCGYSKAFQHSDEEKMHYQNEAG